MSGGDQVSVVLVGIGDAPAALLGAAEAILGPLPGVTALGFPPNAGAVTVESRLTEALEEAGPEGGVLFVVDLCGSSLANGCYAIAAEEDGCDVLCGMSLAMLMKLFSLDRARLDATELAKSLAETGRRAICLFSQTVGRRRQEIE